jgi:hypothetical protein
LILILAMSLTLTSSTPGMAAHRKRGDVLVNGSFEGGFYATPVGNVGNGWGWFTNEGKANYGFYDDQWQPVVAEGDHSQLIGINTYKIPDADPDRYAGIYQTVKVVPGKRYVLRMQEIIRSTQRRGDLWRYVIQVGWIEGASNDWTQVDNWVGFRSRYYPLTEPVKFRRFGTPITPQSDTITVYIRIWKKWGDPEVALNVNLDAITLTGPIPNG